MIISALFQLRTRRRELDVCVRNEPRVYGLLVWVEIKDGCPIYPMRRLCILELDDGPRRGGAVESIERLVDLGKLDAVRDHLVEL
jgi:hypothetical protein